MRYKEKQKSKNIIAGGVAFHGTTAPRVYSILTTQLRSGTTVDGVRRADRGIFYAHEPKTSIRYMRNDFIKPWKHSGFKESMVMLGLEISGTMP